MCNYHGFLPKTAEFLRFRCFIINLYSFDWAANPAEQKGWFRILISKNHHFNVCAMFYELKLWTKRTENPKKRSQLSDEYK